MFSLSADRWRVLSPYLDAALEMPTDQRSRWLASVADGDTAIAADLEALLVDRDHARRENFLEYRAPHPAAAPTRTLAGRVVGAYRLIECVGRGGMGSVWRAERADRTRRRAAIKLLNMPLIGGAGERRFRREAHILTRLEHPHVARLFEADVTDEGQPYLVLDYVDGQPIDRYCHQHALGVDARLRLMLDLLRAVSYVHANCVIHRDIKPDNVLVSRTGHVMLLDFGIATMMACGDASREQSAITEQSGRALTPQYAAPEQLTGGAATPATDVYALGALLYVLLTGQHPAGPSGQSPASLIRAIVDTIPARPSEVVTCPTLRGQLQGILDTIVMRALEKTTPPRYPTVAALASDIRHALRGRGRIASPRTRCTNGALAAVYASRSNRCASASRRFNAAYSTASSG